MTGESISVIFLASSLLYELVRINYIDIICCLGIAWFALREGRKAFEKTQSGALTCS